ncbi:MAG: DUF2336 domain-containing protein [Rickettsiales bacterium]
MPNNSAKKHGKNSAALSDADVDLLLESPQEKKMRVADMVAEYYARGGFSESELKMAGDVLMALAEHAETEVRRHLAEGVKSLPNMSAEVIKKLAQDVAAISVPVLECSSVLTDEDLIEIVNATKDMEKLRAVAGRASVSEPLSDALIEQGDSSVAQRLLGNAGADISGVGYDAILDAHSGDVDMADAMATRDKLPIRVVERLIDAVSEKVRMRLAEAYPLDEKTLEELMRDTGDIALINMITNDDAKLLYGRFRHFAKKHNFPDSFLPVLSLCIGNIRMFAILASRETKTPMLNVRRLLGDESGKGFRALYRRMKLPHFWQDACASLASILREWERDGNNVYDDIFLSLPYADAYPEAFESDAAETCEDKAAVAAISNLVRNSLLLCRKEKEGE